MDTALLKISYTLNDIDDVVKQFWEACNKCKLIAFSGEMGAGKTTFIHKLCDMLKVEDVVSSPTFALINEYHFTDMAGTDNIIYHLDWYRLKDSAEAINAGMEDCIEQAMRGEAWCFIEWPEKAHGLLQKPYVWVSINTTDETGREMEARLVS